MWSPNIARLPFSTNYTFFVFRTKIRIQCHLWAYFWRPRYGDWRFLNFRGYYFINMKKITFAELYIKYEYKKSWRNAFMKTSFHPKTKAIILRISALLYNLTLPIQNVWHGSKSVITFGLIKILTHHFGFYWPLLISFVLLKMRWYQKIPSKIYLPLSTDDWVQFLISKITLLNSCPMLANSPLNINGCQKYAFLLFSIQRVWRVVVYSFSLLICGCFRLKVIHSHTRTTTTRGLP